MKKDVVKSLIAIKQSEIPFDVIGRDIALPMLSTELSSALRGYQPSDKITYYHERRRMYDRNRRQADSGAACLEMVAYTR